MSLSGRTLGPIVLFLWNALGGASIWNPLFARAVLPKLARITGLLSLLAGPALATTTNSSITLAWDPDTGSTTVGYRLYEGAASHTYTSSIDVGTNISVAVSNLATGVAYFFAVTAYDPTGLESDFSAEVSYTVSSISTAPPGRPTLKIQVTSSRQVILSGTSPAGHTYDVLAAPDLASWRIIGRATPDQSGSFRFTDPVLANLSSRSYLLQEPLAPATFAVALTADDQILVTGTGPIGHTYNIQMVDDSHQWTTIGTATMDGKGSFQFIDWGASSLLDRGYRLQVAPTAPTLEISVLADGSVSLTGTGPTSQRYYVEASEDLAAWETIGATWIDYTGVFEFNDWYAPYYPTRFYRLRQDTP